MNMPCNSVTCANHENTFLLCLMSVCGCSFDLNKIAQAQGDKAARKQSTQLRNAAMDSLAEVGAATLYQFLS